MFPIRDHVLSSCISWHEIHFVLVVNGVYMVWDLWALAQDPPPAERLQRLPKINLMWEITSFANAE